MRWILQAKWNIAHAHTLSYCLTGKEAYMAESSTFYKAFGPAMDVLQKKGTAGNYLCA